MKQIFLALFILTLSCTQPPEREVELQPNSYSKEYNYINDGIIYFKDIRTMLCFAMVKSRTYMDNRVTSITEVPCTDLVMKQIEFTNEN